MSDKNSVVAVFASHNKAEDAVRELQKSGFDMKKLSIVGKDFHTNEDVVGYYTTGDRMMYWGKLGAFWGGVWGLLIGWAFFWVPGVGPLLVAGPLVAAIVGALADAALVGGLVRWEQDFTAWASPQIACLNTKRPSNRAVLFSSLTGRLRRWRKQRASFNRPTPQKLLRMSADASSPVPVGVDIRCKGRRAGGSLILAPRSALGTMSLGGVAELGNPSHLLYPLRPRPLDGRR